jgi:hypothetical protein
VSIKFIEGNPPAKDGDGRTRWPDVVAELRQKPGQWALVAQDASVGIAGHLKTRYGLEVRARGQVKSRAAEIYARFPAAD